MSQDQKKNLILEAAQKRFSHFGVDKTTMNEIAQDIAISKASLYYYFPDKLNLYAAVLQKIIDVNKVAVPDEKETLPAILKYLDERTEFIIKHYNILEYLKSIGTAVPDELKPVFSSARNTELNVLAKILAQGAASSVLKVDDPKRAAELLLDCLDGLRFSSFSHQNNFFPEKSQFIKQLNREKEFAVIFVKGLTC